MIDMESYPRLAERLAKKAPHGRSERLREFATDLAVGYDEGAWGLKLWLTPMDDNSLHWEILDAEENDLLELPMDKWENPAPDITGLRSVGYVEAVDKERKDPYFGAFLLTEKCLSLSKSRAKVFISYRRDESSAFALLLEARIKQETNAKPFLDKNLQPGEEWHGVLEGKIREAEAFICLLGKNTLDSDFVRKEIQWALDSRDNKLIIPVWHNQFDGHQSEYQELLNPINQIQAVVIKDESAIGYDTSINLVLNRLEYSTVFDEVRTDSL